MNIFFVIDSLRPGGAERQLVELIKGLTITGGYNLSLGVLENAVTGYSDIIRDLQVDIHCFPRRKRFDFSPIMAMRRHIEKKNIHFVHGFLNIGALFGLLAGKVAGRPVVCSSIRNAADESFLTGLNIRLEAHIADILISNSHAGFMNRFRKMKSNFRLIYNGVDFNRFMVTEEDTETIKKQFGLNRFQHIIGMVATFSGYKDHDSAIRAAKIVLQEYPDVGFLFVGDGPELNRMKEMVSNNGLNGKILFTGYRKDVEEFYPLMDICLLLTRSQRILEGISNSLLEAMASGVPVIATAGGGTDELISHGKTGIVVPPGEPGVLADKIKELLGNPDRRSLLSEKARDDVHKRFNLQRYVQEHIAVYNMVLASRKS